MGKKSGKKVIEIGVRELASLNRKIERQKLLDQKAKEKRQKAKEKVDGWNPKDVTKLRNAIRQVWSWSQPARLVRARCLLKNGFSKCEKCRKTVPKIFVDHIQVMGSIFGEGYIERMGAPSTELQGLCKKCHDAKTALERKAEAAVKAEPEDFF